jgi:capsular polysaccharide biosynthesis protein
MIDTSWHVEDPGPDEAPARPAPGLVNWHFLRSALRRRWRVWVAAALVGMMLGIAWTTALPSKSHGTVTILLAHDEGTDPVIAMSTDLSLLRTRTVAASTIERLDLQMTPEEFEATTTATAATPTVLVIDVVAPDDRAAVARAAALADTYLKFRSAQLESQAKALTDGYEQRVKDLQQRVDELTAEYGTLSQSNSADQDEATDLLTQRSQASAEISRIQQQIEDINLSSEAVVTASHVMDPAAAVPRSPMKRAALNTGSGMIGGLAAGIGLVLFLALTSDRLRRREEIALALATPVRYSAGKVTGRGTRWRRRASADRGLQVLAHGLESAIPKSKSGRTTRLALVAVDDVEAAALTTARVAAHLAAEGKAVFLVDLSDSGLLKGALKKALARQQQRSGQPAVEPVLFRPEGQPFLARGPVGAPASATTELAKGNPRRPAWNRADVVLTLAEVNPSVGVDHLGSWVDRVVLLVAAGRSSAERLRTTGELVRSAGLRLSFAMMVGADRNDESSGLRDSAEPGWTGAGGSW